MKNPARGDLDVRLKKFAGFFVLVLFLLATAGAASAATLDLPKWVIVPEDSTFSDVTLFCGLDAMDTTNNVTPCYLNGALVNATIVFNSTTGYPKLVSGRIGNAFEFDGNANEYIELPHLAALDVASLTITAWVYITQYGTDYAIVTYTTATTGYLLYITSTGYLTLKVGDGSVATYFSSTEKIPAGQWTMVTVTFDNETKELKMFFNADEVLSTTYQGSIAYSTEYLNIAAHWRQYKILNGKIDEVRIYNRPLTSDEIKLLYYAGRKKLSEPANFRQIFSPMIDLTRDRATFYAGLEVSTSDPSGYVPVPESAVNMSITSAPKLTSDYTNADFYYQGHYWYRADKIQFNLPIQFETVRSSGNFEKVIILDSDSKQLVFEKEFKVTNPTGARINVIYTVDPAALGFSPLQFPSFELDGAPMASWSPQNSTNVYAIRTDVLEPGEISTHWVKAIWVIKKDEVSFPAKLDDFRQIDSFAEAQRLFENMAKGKGDTYVSVISITSNADVSNVTIYVPLKDIEDPEDVIEAVALTGTRETLEVKQLEDGRVVVKVPADAFVSGQAEIKILYNKETSWWQSILARVKSILAKFFGIFDGHLVFWPVAHAYGG